MLTPSLTIPTSLRDLLHTKYKSSTKAKKQRRKEQQEKHDEDSTEPSDSSTTAPDPMAYFAQANQAMLKQIKEEDSPEQHHAGLLEPIPLEELVGRGSISNLELRSSFARRTMASLLREDDEEDDDKPKAI